MSNSFTQSTETAVLIVGGGPAGATSALLLARYGIPTILVEKQPGTFIHPRARGLNVRTMEIYRALGLEDAIRSAGDALAKSRYMLFVETLAGREIRRVPDDDLIMTGEALDRVTPCRWCQCAQDALEPIVLKAAAEAGADLRFNTRLTGFAQDADGVTAQLSGKSSTGEQDYTIRAQYVIGADGAHSLTRRNLGVTFPNRKVLGHYLNIYFRADLSALVADRWFALCFVENPALELECMLLAVNNTDRWLLNVEYHPEAGQAPEDFSPERCINLIRQAVGQADLPVELFSVLPWESAAGVADRFQVDRTFLLGDAAHGMPPAGGFGLNTGVQDAHNLAWKLAAVLNGTASPTLLATYEAERLPVAHRVVDQAVAEVEAPTPDTPGRPPGGDEAGDPMLEQMAVILGNRYVSAAIMPTDNADAEPDLRLPLDGRPGTRAPHRWIRPINGTNPRSTLDLIDGHFVLITGVDGQAWIDATKAGAISSPAIDVYRIGTDLIPLASEDDLAGAFGITSAGAVLIRPDGVVAWRSNGSITPAEDLAAVLKQIGGKN